MKQEHFVFGQAFYAVFIEVTTDASTSALVVGRPIAIGGKTLTGGPAPFGHHCGIRRKHGAGCTAKFIVLSGSHPSANHLEAIHDVHATAKGAEYEVGLALLQHDVADGNGGNAFFPTLPLLATVMAPPQSLFCSAPQ